MTSSSPSVDATVYRVHMLHEPEPDARALLESLVDPNVALTFGDELPVDAVPELLVAGRPEERHLDAAPGLRILLIPWAGLPAVTAELLRGYPGTAVHNIHHNAGSAAELAFALALAAAKRIVPGDRALRTGDWSPRYGSGGVVRLDGGRALILGYGAIGRRVGVYCRAFGMHVTGVRRRVEDERDRTAPTEDGAARAHTRGVGDRVDAAAHLVVGREAVDGLLPETDVVFVTLPLTPETEGFLDARRLALLPSGAILVNVGRGAVVDEEALYRALAGGTMGAAGLDVWYNYPEDEACRASTSPSRFDFGALENVVMSPHRGGAPGTARTERERMEAIAVSVNAAARGGSVPHLVGLDDGY